MKKFIFLTFILIFGCTYLRYLEVPWVDIPNFCQVDERIFRGGRPTKEGFKKLKLLGVKTVVSLRGEDKATLEDRKIATELGFKFYNIPLSVYRKPTDKEVIRFLEIVLNKENKPLFVYCQSGRDRTGAMIALYRVVVCNWQPKQAYKEAKRLGFWPYYGDAELKKFIHQLKDKKIYFKKAKELLDLE